MRSFPFTRNQLSTAGALQAAGLCLLGLALTWIVAELVPIAHVKDAVALHDFTELSRPRVDLLANGLLGLLDPLRYTLWGVALMSVALSRSRPRVALAVVLVMALAPLTSEALKPLLAHSHARIGWNVIVDASWPSGHSTAAMSLALCAVLVSPSRWRPAVAILGSVFAIAVGFSLLVLAWHMPSDVFGGYLVAALWSALAVAALCYAEERHPSASRQARVPARSPGATPKLESVLAAVLAICLSGVVFVLAAPFRVHRAERLASDHLSLIVAASAIAALAAAIASTMAFMLRR